MNRGQSFVSESFIRPKEDNATYIIKPNQLYHEIVHSNEVSYFFLRNIRHSQKVFMDYFILITDKSIIKDQLFRVLVEWDQISRVPCLCHNHKGQLKSTIPREKRVEFIWYDKIKHLLTGYARAVKFIADFDEEKEEFVYGKTY